jgi:hypothetical protein
MEFIEKRKLSELLALYSLHPERIDIYVEGITDKLIYEQFLENNKIDDFKVLEIDSIDFSELYVEYPNLKRNMKNKLVKLSETLETKFKNELKHISCIVDKDFDYFLDRIISNSYLLYTDYCSIEMYLLNARCLSIFFKNILHGFPITVNKVIKEVSIPLEEKFFIRLALSQKQELKDEALITDIKKTILIDKSNGTIRFDANAHLLKILQNMRLGKKSSEYIKCIEEFKKKKTNDIRNQARGHDFVRILFLYIDKIKNNISLSEKALERSLFQCFDYDDLYTNKLFVHLKNKCA